jgi:catechol 2,3-dioxygenase-like lactoylglutathione lyase family enzyme
VSIGGLDHVALGVPDLDARIALLVDTCSMRLLRRGTVAATGQRMAMLADAAGSRLELVEVLGAPGPVFLHLAFRTDDVDTAYGEAIARGMQSKRTPHALEAEQARTALLTDGRGFDLQVISYGEAAPRRTAGHRRVTGTG